MELLTDKTEVLKCKIDVEGADTSSVIVRLCLDFEDNKNLHFYGELESDGTCTFTIPKLDRTLATARMSIEAIIDATYFKLYDSQVSLGKSVAVRAHRITRVPVQEKSVRLSEENPFSLEPIPETETANPFAI